MQSLSMCGLDGTFGGTGRISRTPLVFLDSRNAARAQAGRTSTRNDLLTSPTQATDGHSPASRSPAQEGLRVRLARGVTWNLTGTAFNQGSTFVVNVLLAHVLDMTAFGAYVMTQSTILTLSALAQLGVGYTATKYVAEFRGTDRARTGRLLGLLAAISAGMGVAAGSILLIGARWLALDLLREPHLTTAFALASVGVFFTVTNGFLMGVLAGLESYASLGRAGIFSGTFYIIACVAGGLLGGLPGAVAAVAVSAAFQCAVLARAVVLETRRQGIPVRFAAAREETSVMWKFAVPAALNGFVAMPGLWWGNALLARQDGGYHLLALFSAANNFRLVVLFLPYVMNNVTMSLLNFQKGIGDDPRFRRLFWFNLAATGAIVFVGAAGISVCGRWLLRFFGPGFVDGYPALLVLMMATLPETVTQAAFQIIQSRERIWLSFIGVAIPCYGTLSLVAWFAVPGSGPVGLASAYLAGWLVALVTTGLIVSRLGIRLPGSAPLVTQA
jgi:O-antigen/teichoic acid export membrane protein